MISVFQPQNNLFEFTIQILKAYKEKNKKNLDIGLSDVRSKDKVLFLSISREEQQTFLDKMLGNNPLFILFLPNNNLFKFPK